MSCAVHYVVLLHNTSQPQTLIQALLQGTPPPAFEALAGQTGLLFSRSEVKRYISEEERHELEVLTRDTSQSLKSMSSGEQKKALLRHLLAQDSKFTGFKNGAAFYWGAYLRAKDAVTAKILLEYAGWGFGVSYDINTSNLKQVTNTRGGIEFSLRFVAPNPFIKTYGANHSRY